MNDDIWQILSHHDCLVADGFDDALVGFTESEPVRAVYDYGRCVGILMDHMSWENAVEFMSYNVVSADLGPKTPLFINFMHEDFAP